MQRRKVGCAAFLGKDNKSMYQSFYLSIYLLVIVNSEHPFYPYLFPIKTNKTVTSTLYIHGQYQTHFRVHT